MIAVRDMPPKGAERGSLMRRSLMLLATVAILIGLVAAPAAADKPFDYRIPDVGFLEWDDFDACTGEAMHVKVYLEVSEHQHRNNVTGIAKGYGETSTGYVLSGSPNPLMIKGSWEDEELVATAFTDIWTKPNGDKMRQHSVWVDKSGGGPLADPQVDIFTSSCIGGPTVGPLP